MKSAVHCVCVCTQSSMDAVVLMLAVYQSEYSHWGTAQSGMKSAVHCVCVCTQSSMDAVALMLAVYQSEYSRCVPAILSSADCRLVFALRPKTTAYRAVYASVSTAASVRYDTIQDAVLTCAPMLTRVSLIYRTEPTTKKW